VHIDEIDIRKVAFLLDVDGTILDIAATPLDVVVPDRLKRALHTLHDRTGGALAFVSGRPLAQLDRLFGPFRFPAVAGHGAEMRVVAEAESTSAAAPLAHDLKAQIGAFASKLDGLILEDKGYSIALHFRLAPEHADVVRQAVAAACAPYPSDLIEVLPGKSVIEIKSTLFNKGTGIRELMKHPPFHGRRPVFVGDDITDEAAFAVLPDFDGLGFSVGHAMHGLAGHFARPHDVRDWLYRAAAVEPAQAEGAGRQ
jgi:trehalose 6-phosphate phosphatase